MNFYFKCDGNAATLSIQRSPAMAVQKAEPATEMTRSRGDLALLKSLAGHHRHAHRAQLTIEIWMTQAVYAPNYYFYNHIVFQFRNLNKVSTKPADCMIVVAPAMKISTDIRRLVSASLSTKFPDRDGKRCSIGVYDSENLVSVVSEIFAI